MNALLSNEVLQYIQNLSSITEREQIYRYLDRQRELGYRLIAPVSKPLRDGIHELRPGPHRLLFFYHGSQILVAHAFRKKTRRTPDREIDAAIRKREKVMHHEKLA